MCGGSKRCAGSTAMRTEAELNTSKLQEQVLQKLIPPVRLVTLCVSNTGMFAAGGTLDGRVFFWEVSDSPSVVEESGS